MHTSFPNEPLEMKRQNVPPGVNNTDSISKISDNPRLLDIRYYNKLVPTPFSFIRFVSALATVFGSFCACHA